MGQYRDEVVRTSVETEADVVEQRTVREDGLGARVVETTTTIAPPVPIESTRLVRRWWRPAAVAGAGTEYVTAPSDGLDPNLARLLRISWFLVGLLDAVLALRFVLSLLAANERNDFAAAIYGLTALFVGPFRTLFATPTSGGSSLELYTLVAVLIFFVAWWAVVRKIGVVLDRPVDV
jgi:hypothetical protein